MIAELSKDLGIAMKGIEISTIAAGEHAGTGLVIMRIGVLALQGAVREHLRSIEKCGAEALAVKWPKELEGLDALILPGGESTTMRRLIDRYGLMEPLRGFAASGKPMFGTCAGLILLAGEVAGASEPHLGVMDVVVERNSFGRQIDSFEADLAIAGLDSPFNAVLYPRPAYRKRWTYRGGAVRT